MMIFAAVFAFISSAVLNDLLSSVRSLGIITHFLMMKLFVSGFTVIFFSKILTYVAFDLIWFAEDIYNETLNLPDDGAYSD